MKSASRVAWGGELRLLPGAVHPRTGKRGVVAYFIYANTGDPLTVAQIAEVHTRLATYAPFAADLLVLVGGDTDQIHAFTGLAPELAAQGIDVSDPATLLPPVGAEGYSLGEGYGFVRVVPQGTSPTDYGPRDLLVTEAPTEDLGLVAGLVSSLSQNVHSHVNLRLREKMIPNARIPDIYQDQVVSELDGKLAHLVVTDTTAKIEPAMLVDAEAFWAAHRPALPPLQANLDETRVRDFSEIGAADTAAFGAKAANLGELHALLLPVNRAEGFGLPLSMYRDFMLTSGLAAQVDSILNDPRTATDAVYRRSALAVLQKSIENAPVPAGWLDRLRAAAARAFGPAYAQQPLRFRSSSNAEDGETISGAGLYDSYRGCFADDDDADDLGPSRCLSAEEQATMSAELATRQAELAAHPERDWLPAIIADLQGDLNKERPVARALRKVYASLWNERAFEERSYWGLDHRTAFMGVAVNSSFVLEQVNAVAVTNLPGAPPSDLPLYRVVSQKNDEAVVRPPDPTEVAETLTFARTPANLPTDISIVVASSLSHGPLWPSGKLAELAGLLFQIQDHYATKVFPDKATVRLDLEIKLTHDDRVVIKQVRPYIDVGP